MAKTTPLFKWLQRLPLACLCVGMTACVTAQTGAAGPPLGGHGPHGISEIALERDCFGCPKGVTLLLRSDGTTLYTQVGKARHGTRDEVRQGRVSVGEFDALARLLVQRGFFQMKDRYEDPELQDGAWATLRATRGQQQKEVFVRDDAAPPEWRAVEAAIDVLSSRIRPVP
jgi:hypothetical protein